MKNNHTIEVAKAVGCKAEDIAKELILGLILQTSKIILKKN